MEPNLPEQNKAFPRCLNCMAPLLRPGSVCSRCGGVNAHLRNQPHQLPVGTLLAGRYLVGTVLGQGGFGITYIGWDMESGVKVAIKEYFPEGCVSRNPADSVTLIPIYGEREQIFEGGRKRFTDEAKTLMRFSGEPCIVNIRAFFSENDTAYIVMDYVDGVTLKQAVKDAGGKLPTQQVLTMLRPIMSSLYSVHRAGLIHRDISPDNIILRPDGSVVLIDFGAARQISASGERSNTVNVKHGYAPEEQYRKHGEQGPWTDVYALCATIYRLTTGAKPVQALERLAGEDTLDPPNRLGANFTAAQQKALMKGLSVHAADRQQDMRTLSRQLCGDLDKGRSRRADPYRSGDASREGAGNRKKRRTVRRLLGLIAALAVLVAVVALWNAGVFARISKTAAAQLSAETPAPAPSETPTLSPTDGMPALLPEYATASPAAEEAEETEQPALRPVPTLPEHSSVETPARGRVLSGEANLRSAPDYSCEVLEKLYNGAQVDVYFLVSGFYYVKDVDTEQEGYIHQSLLEVTGVFDNRGGEEPTPTPKATPTPTPVPQADRAVSLADVKYVPDNDGAPDEAGHVNRFGHMMLSVQNNGEKTVSQVQLKYTCYDGEDTVIGTGSDTTDGTLGPGETTRHSSRDSYYITGHTVKVVVRVTAVRFTDGTQLTENLPTKTVKLG